MTNRTLAAAAAALMLAACGGGDKAANKSARLTENEILPMPANATGPDANVAAPMAQTGQDYVRIASASDLFEIESSRLALERAQNAQVREFAQMLIADHTRSTEQLRAAAAQAQPAVEVPAPQLNPEQQTMMEGLRAAQGAAFDQLYMQGQVQAHQQTLAALQAYARGGDAPSLRQHAETTSGPVERHLERARELATRPQ
jgi:putative membrane protein